MPDRFVLAAERMVAGMPDGPSPGQLRQRRESRQRHRFVAVVLVATVLTLNGVWWASRPATVVPTSPATTAAPMSTTTTTTTTSTTTTSTTTTSTMPNRPPTAQPDAVAVVQDGTIIVNVLANDVDPDGQRLSIGQISSNTDGRAVVEGDAIAYEPSPGFTGVALITYTVVDSAGWSATGLLTVTVMPV